MFCHYGQGEMAKAQQGSLTDGECGIFNWKSSEDEATLSHFIWL